MKFQVLRILTLLISPLAVKVIAQTLAPCTEAEDTSCLPNLCISTDGVAECQLDTCAQGYISFINDTCVEIASIDFQRFRNTRNVEYRALGNITFRLGLLLEAAQEISAWNAQIPPPEFTFSLNKYAADDEEDRSHLAGFRADTKGETLSAYAVPTSSALSYPTSVDWRNISTFVKDQGRCGCCWSVALIGSIEGAVTLNAANNGFLQSLSFQQLISCSLPLNSGCNGGNLVIGAIYATENLFGGVDGKGGLASNNEYPFSDENGDTTEVCRVRETPEDYNVTVIADQPAVVVDFDDTLTFEERVARVKFAVSKVPVAITIRSNCKEISRYQKGVLTSDGDCRCESVSCIDHAILLVGYNDDVDTPYWLLKNSWGDTWGEDGYFRIAQEQKDRRWGLYGIMGHSVAASLNAINVTAEQDDVEDDSLEVLGIILIIAAGVALLMCLVTAFAVCCRK